MNIRSNVSKLIFLLCTLFICGTTLAFDQTKIKQAELHESYVLINEGKFDQAERVLQAVLEKDPDNPLALNNLAVIMIRKRKFGEASKYLKRAEPRAQGYKVGVKRDFHVDGIGVVAIPMTAYTAKQDLGPIVQDNIDIVKYLTNLATAEKPPPSPTPPSPTPPPPTRPPPTPIKPPPLYWNVWAEKKKDERYPKQPPTHLIPGEEYRICLDLAALKYLVDGWSNVRIGVTEVVPEWLKWGLDHDDLKVLLLADPSKLYIEKNVKEFKIDLNRLRKVWEEGFSATPGDAFAELREALDKKEKAAFQFGGTFFNVTAKNREGWAPVAISIWYKGRPIDEVSYQFCIANSPETMKEKCRIVKQTAAPQRLLPVQAASEESEPPAAAVHFVSLGQGERVTGIFRANNWGKDRFLVWWLSQSAETFKTTISNQVKLLSSPVMTDENLLEGGDALFLDLFPVNSIDGKEVYKEVSNFFKDQLQKDKNAGDYVPPSIFVRMVQAGPEPGAPVPLGLLAVKLDEDKGMTRENGRFLGEYFLIEAPLEVQSYKPSTECLNRWVMVLPPPPKDEEDEVKKELGPDLCDAHAELSEAIANRSVPKVTFHNQMKEVSKWLRCSAPSKEKDPPTILATLSHHTSDSLYFFDPEESTKDVPLYHSKIIREFRQPSVAILAGCGTGSKEAVALIQAFNKHGFTAIIATSSGISGSMAGAFLRVFSEEISTPNPIGLAYWKATNKLAKMKPKAGGPFGAKAYKFSLLGNGKVQVCLPKKEEKRESVATP